MKNNIIEIIEVNTQLQTYYEMLILINKEELARLQMKKEIKPEELTEEKRILINSQLVMLDDLKNEIMQLVEKVIEVKEELTK